MNANRIEIEFKADVDWLPVLHVITSNSKKTPTSGSTIPRPPGAADIAGSCTRAGDPNLANFGCSHFAWSSMEGDEKARTCPRCGNRILNISSMPSLEALHRLKAMGEAFPLRGHFFHQSGLLLYGPKCTPRQWHQLHRRLALFASVSLFTLGRVVLLLARL